jgi:hypothetical protein
MSHYGSLLPKCDANVQHFILSHKHFTNFFRKLPVNTRKGFQKRASTGKLHVHSILSAKIQQFSQTTKQKLKKTPHHHDGELVFNNFNNA